MWEIPLAQVAGVLAVTFTGGASDRVVEPAGSPPIQRPEPTPPALPPDSPAAPEPVEADAPASVPATREPVEPPPDPEPTLPPLPEPAPVGSEVEAPSMDAPGASSKAAKADGVLRPTDKRRFFSIGVGGATGTNPYSFYYGGGGMDFQWEAAIGSHARRRPNFGGAFVFQQRKGFLNELSFVGRFQWDKPLTDRFALYSSVNLDLGVNIAIGYAGYLGFAGASAMIGAGWSFKAVLAERFMAFVRPVNPNLIAPSFYTPPLFVTIRWDVMAGLGVVW